MAIEQILKLPDITLLSQEPLEAKSKEYVADISRLIGKIIPSLNQSMPQSGPRFFVAVTGTSSEPPQFVQQTEALARVLAENRIGVITPKYAGVMRLFSEKYANSIEQLDLPVEQYLRHRLNDSPASGKILGSVAITEQGISQKAEIVRDSLAIIVIGGRANSVLRGRTEGSSRALVDFALAEGKLVIPFPGTRGVAENVRQKLLNQQAWRSHTSISDKANHIWQQDYENLLRLDANTFIDPVQTADRIGNFLVSYSEAQSVATNVGGGNPDEEIGASLPAEPPAPETLLAAMYTDTATSKESAELMSEDSPEAQASKIVVVQQIQQTYQALYQSARTRAAELDDFTLDVHLAPSPKDSLDNAAQQKPTLEKRSYQATLTLRKEDGAATTFEGLFHWAEISGGQRQGVALHRSLFPTDEPKENETAVFKGSPGKKSLAAGYQYAKARAAKALLRFQLRIRSDAPELHRIPWEYLSDPAGDGDPLAVSPHTPFARFLAVGAEASEPVPLLSDAPLRVLAAFASPDDLTSVEPDYAELRGLAPIEPSQLNLVADKTKELGANVEFQVLPDSVSLPALRQELQKGIDKGRPFHVLHLLCHGVTATDGRSCLVLCQENSRRAVLETEERVGEQLREFLINSHLQLVVLASCFTALPVQQDAFKGVARRLVEEGTPAVIAMQDVLEFEAAQHFSERLYERLSIHGAVDKAINAARAELYRRRAGSGQPAGEATVGRLQWGVPVLFLRRPDGLLFKRENNPLLQDQPDISPNVPPTEARPYNSLQARAAGADPQRLAGSLLTQAAAQWPLPVSILGSTPLRVLMETVPQDTNVDFGSGPVRQRNAKDAEKLNALTVAAWLRGETYRQEERPADFPMLTGMESAVFQAVAALEAGKHIILTGPPGTGKTTLAEALCRYAQERRWCEGPELVTATVDWTTFDTTGGYAPDQRGSLQFRPGVFLKAIAEDKWLLIDEINRTEIDKAFGELFTVLSGQTVTLPYQNGSRVVRVVPHGAPEKKHRETKTFDFCVPQHWRIIGTMNVYDKATLYSMSYAFMRRFAFIDVPIPKQAAYDALLTKFLQENECVDEPKTPFPLVTRFFDYDQSNADAEIYYPIMHRRGLGPAIAKDLVAFLAQRYRSGDEQTWIACFAEALALYIIPQLEGLDREAALLCYEAIAHHLLQFDADAMSLGLIRARFRDQFPFIEAKGFSEADINAKAKASS